MVSAQIPAEGQLVLDSSAVLAWLLQETGHQAVLPLLPRAIINTVNWAEVIQRGDTLGLFLPEMLPRVEAEGLTVTEFSIDEAATAGRLRAATRSAGLSLGDRACLASALIHSVPAVTADRPWLRVSVGVDIVLIR